MNEHLIEQIKNSSTIYLFKAFLIPEKFYFK